MSINVGQFVSKRAAMRPDQEAIFDVGKGLRLSYSELDRRCNRLANGLLGNGLTCGDRIATLLMNSTDFVEVFFGTAYSKQHDIRC